MSKFLWYYERNGKKSAINADQFSHLTRCARDDVGFINTITGRQIEICCVDDFARQVEEFTRKSSANTTTNPFASHQQVVYEDGDESWRIRK